MNTKRKKSMYNLIYRIRKTTDTVRINIKTREIYFDYLDRDLIEEKKVKRLRTEFRFSAQSEFRK